MRRKGELTPIGSCMVCKLHHQTQNSNREPKRHRAGVKKLFDNVSKEKKGTRGRQRQQQRPPLEQSFHPERPTPQPHRTPWEGIRPRQQQLQPSPDQPWSSIGVNSSMTPPRRGNMPWTPLSPVPTPVGQDFCPESNTLHLDEPPGRMLNHRRAPELVVNTSMPVKASGKPC